MPSLNRSPSIHRVITGISNNSQKSATIALLNQSQQHLYYNIPLSTIVLNTPESTPSDNRKKPLMEAKANCIQLDTTCSQSPLSLSIYNSNSIDDVSVESLPIYATRLQSCRDDFMTDTLLTPEILRSDCFSSHLVSQYFNSSSSDCYTHTAVSLSTIYEGTTDMSNDHSLSSYTPRITTLCIIKQTQWHTVQSLSMFHDLDPYQ